MIPPGVEVGQVIPPEIAEEMMAATRARIAARIAEKEAVGDYFGAMVLAGRAEAPAVLYRWWVAGKFGTPRTGSPTDGPMVRELIAHAWCMPEWPQQALGAKQWVDMFRWAGFVTDEPGSEMPTGPIRVYRGATWGRRRGMAWTTDLAAARRFADPQRVRNYGPHELLVFEATINPAAVLALIFGREEAEVVVDPAMLPPIGRSAIVENGAT